METIKEKIIVIIGIVLVIALCCGAYYMLVYQSSDYYTQIDNTKVEKIYTRIKRRCLFKTKSDDD